MRWLVVAIVLVLAGSAAAESNRVVVATSDRVLVTALTDTFKPTGMVVVQVADTAPASIGELATMSRTVAEREKAAAIVWFVIDKDGATLVAYDHGVDRVLVRPLPYAPPLSAERAAETARAARTMLRALKLADEPDRPQRPPPVVIIEKPIYEPPPRVARPWPNVVALAGFGGRYGRLGEDGVVEAQVAAVWRPDALGVIAMGSLSPQANLASPSFMGDVSDNSIAVGARIPFVLARNIAVAGIAGPALHIVRVEGTLGADRVSAQRFDTALRIGASGTYALTSRFDVGLAVSMDTLLKRQRYEVTGGEVLVMPRLQVSVGLMFSVRVL